MRIGRRFGLVAFSLALGGAWLTPAVASAKGPTLADAIYFVETPCAWYLPGDTVPVRAALDLEAACLRWNEQFGGDPAELMSWCPEELERQVEWLPIGLSLQRREPPPEGALGPIRLWGAFEHLSGRTLYGEIAVPADQLPGAYELREDGTFAPDPRLAQSPLAAQGLVVGAPQAAQSPDVLLQPTLPDGPLGGSESTWSASAVGSTCFSWLRGMDLGELAGGDRPPPGSTEPPSFDPTAAEPAHGCATTGSGSTPAAGVVLLVLAVALLRRGNPRRRHLGSAGTGRAGPPRGRHRSGSVSGALRRE